MNPFTMLENLINEHGSSSILRERLLLLKDELVKADKKYVDLQAEADKLREENRDLKHQLATKIVPDEFTKHDGCLFKRDISGKHDKRPYCPKCKIPLWQFAVELPFYECSSCKFNINLHDIPSIIEKLDKQAL